MTRTRGRRFPTVQRTLGVGPFTGLTDSDLVAAGRLDRLRIARNVYLPPGPPGQPVTVRPGIDPAGARLGSTGKRVGQYVGEFVEGDGTTHTIAIVGGQFSEYDWSTDTWTETLTASDFTNASITLDDTAAVFAVPFAGAMVFSDGVNTPWTWDGTAGGGLTKLTNAPVFYGQPVVYYAKLFGIKASERAAFVWSEEGLANTGYEASGYNNAWDPMGAGPLTALAATNSALFVFQARRTLAITGAVSTDFQTAGTRSAVSETIGCAAPAPLVTDAGVWLVDADGRPHVLPLDGGAPVEAWRDATETLATMNRALLDRCRFVELPVHGVVLVGVPTGTDSYPSTWLAYQAPAVNLVGVWGATLLVGDTATAVGAVATAAGQVLNGDGAPVWMYIEATDYAPMAANVGRAFAQAIPDAQVYGDLLLTSRLSAVDVELPPLGADLRTEQAFHRVDLVFAGETALTDVSMGLRTPRQTLQPNTSETLPYVFDVPFPGDGLIWDVGNWDEENWGASTRTDAHVAVGLGTTMGRWLALRFRLLNANDFALVGASVDATDLHTDWGAP